MRDLAMCVLQHESQIRRREATNARNSTYVCNSVERSTAAISMYGLTRTPIRKILKCFMKYTYGIGAYGLMVYLHLVCTTCKFTIAATSILV